MGYNYYGELGDGTFTNASRPEQIVASGVVGVAAGSGHSLFIKTNGSLWAMGQNNYGQLGNGKYSSLPPFGTNQPIQIVSSDVMVIAAGLSHSLFIKTNGSLWAMGENRYGELGDGTLHETNRPEQIVSSGVTAIAAGIYFSLFLKSDGSLWAMGENNNGELGNGTFNNTNRPVLIVSNRVVAIVAGGYH